MTFTDEVFYFSPIDTVTINGTFIPTLIWPPTTVDAVGTGVLVWDFTDGWHGAPCFMGNAVLISPFLCVLVGYRLSDDQ